MHVSDCAMSNASSFAALKIKACDLSQWSPDLENNIATATKAPVEIEIWGNFPKIHLGNTSWIQFFDETQIDLQDFLQILEDEGHEALSLHPLLCNALIYDAKRRQLIAWRGQLSRPLFWTIQNHHFIISNGMCGPIRAGWIGLSPNFASIASYLYFGQVPEDSSLIEGLNKLPLYQGVVYKLSSGHLFEFQTSKNIQYQPDLEAMHFDSPLEAIWYYQEPRADFFFSHDPLFRDFNNTLETTSPLKTASTIRLQIAIYLITHVRGVTRWGKWIRLKALRSLYRPLELLIQKLQKSCVFDYQMISSEMLLSSDVIFTPWHFLQTLSKEHLFNNLRSWPKDLKTNFHQIIPTLKAPHFHFQLSKPFLTNDKQWKSLLHKLDQSTLIEEGIIQRKLLDQLNYALDIESIRSKLQISTLLALELWLKIFIDQHAQTPTKQDWKTLFD